MYFYQMIDFIFNERMSKLLHYNRLQKRKIMKLYLVRHGDYVMNQSHQDELSEKGIKEIEQLAYILKPLKIRISHFFHSSKLRTQQTAYLLAKSLTSTKSI